MGLAQLLINGVISGSLYALIAVGFSLIYSILKFLHFAHGAVVMIGAFTSYTLYSVIGIPFILAFVITILFAGILGLVIDRLTYRPLRKNHAKSLAFLIVSLGVFSFLEALVLVFYGPGIRNYGFELSDSLSFFGASITPIQIVVIVISVVLLVLVQMFLKFSRLGVSLRAMSDNQIIAASVGINIERSIMITMFIGSALAGAAGSLVGIIQNIEPLMGFSAILKGFTAAVLGGIGSVPAAMFGGFVLGIIENLGIWFLPSAFKDAIAFVILIIVLLLRPRGLFGRRVRL